MSIFSKLQALARKVVQEEENISQLKAICPAKLFQIISKTEILNTKNDAHHHVSE